MILKGKSLLVLLLSVIIFSGCGVGKTGQTSGNNAQTQETKSNSNATKNAILPPLPDNISKKGKLVVGVKVDFPPFGFINQEGKNDGYDIDFAKELAKYAFGSSDAIEFVSVTSANRVPFLNTKKVDLLVATLGVTEERKKVIDYTKPYYSSGHMLLVPKSSTINSYKDLAGKDVVAIKGSTGSIALEKVEPSAKQLKLDNMSEGVKALKSGRGIAMVQDDILLMDIVKNNPDLKVVGEPFESVSWGLGVRKGEEEWLNWLNAAIEKARKEDQFYTWFKKWYKESDLSPVDLPRAQK